MNLLLLIYAMVAGLAGFNAGPSAVARMAAVAETGSLAPVAETVGQPSLAAKALTARATSPAMIPAPAVADARRVPAAFVVQTLVAIGRMAPERRLE